MTAATVTRTEPRHRRAMPPRHTVDAVAVHRAIGGESAGRPLTTAELALAVRELHGRRLSDPRIADRLGVSPRTVLRHRRALELPPNAPGAHARLGPEDRQEIARRIAAGASYCEAARHFRITHVSAKRIAERIAERINETPSNTIGAT